MHSKNSEELMETEMQEESGTLPIKERMERRGIPVAILVEGPEHYLSENELSAEEALKRNEENQKKYKIVECSFTEQKVKLKASIDDYDRSLAVLTALDEQKRIQESGKDELEITYKLDENIYSKAKVDKLEKVCIYLGANVMVEYNMKEGMDMLGNNLKNVKKSLAVLDEELDWIRDQITTSEVNIAQLHNYRVQLNRKKQSEEKSN